MHSCDQYIIQRTIRDMVAESHLEQHCCLYLKNRMSQILSGVQEIRNNLHGLINHVYSCTIQMPEEEFGENSIKIWMLSKLPQLSSRWCQCDGLRNVFLAYLGPFNSCS